MTFPQSITFYPFEAATSNALSDGSAYYIVQVTGYMWSETYSHPLTRFSASILEWLDGDECQDGRVLHEPLNGELTVAAEYSGGAKKANGQHRFYFTNEAQSKRFAKAAPSLVRTGNLFTPLSLKSEQSTQLGGAIGYYLGQKFDSDTIALWFWCKKNLKGRVYEAGEITLFEYDEDLMLFKMAHTGPNKLKPEDML